MPPYVGWRILGVSRFVTPSAWDEDAVEIVMVNQHRDRGYFRIHAIQAADYAIRPMSPTIMMGGPLIKFSTEDPRLTDPGLQYIPGYDGDLYDPPRRFQLLELDQTWIIAVRFEIETLQLTNPYSPKDPPTAQQ
jgi:hypothetical protein